MPRLLCPNPASSALTVTYIIKTSVTCIFLIFCLKLKYSEIETEKFEQTGFSIWFIFIAL